MKLLTKNRIIEKGDEFRNPAGDWKPVPDQQVGLQIMFSPYKEVRRPSENGEAPAKPETRLAQPEKPVSGTPAPEPPAENSHLPTVISPKAHKVDAHKRAADKAFKEAMDKAASRPSARMKLPTCIKIGYTDLSALPNWIGRNGTFKAKALNVYRTDNDLVQLIPEGVRGQAKNALIEIPVADIPRLIEWLERHCSKK